MRVWLDYLTSKAVLIIHIQYWYCVFAFFFSVIIVAICLLCISVYEKKSLQFPSYRFILGKWEHWSSRVQEYMYPSDSVPEYASILVPNVDNIRTKFLIDVIAKQTKVPSWARDNVKSQKHIMLIAENFVSLGCERKAVFFDFCFVQQSSCFYLNN